MALAGVIFDGVPTLVTDSLSKSSDFRSRTLDLGVLGAGSFKRAALGVAGAPGKRNGLWEPGGSLLLSSKYREHNCVART